MTDAQMQKQAGKFMMDSGGPLVVTQCAYCARLSRVTDMQVCQAFPGGIPDAILMNEADHRKPWPDPATGEPGDVGVSGYESLTFVPREGLAADTLALLYAELDQVKPAG